MHPPAALHALLVTLAASALCARSVGPYDGSPETTWDGGDDGGGVGRDGGRFTDLRIEISGVALYAGHTLYMALEDMGSHAVTHREQIVVTGDAFVLNWPGAFDRNTVGMQVHFYVDTDVDDRCTQFDRSWTMRVANDFAGNITPVRFNAQTGADSPTSCAVFITM